MIDQTCTRVALADLLDLSVQRVGVLTKTGILKRGPKGYDVRDAVRSYIGFLKSEPGNLKAERLRYQKLKADLLQLRLDESTGKLVLRDAVEKRTFELARRARDSFQNLPPRVSGICAAETDQDKIFALLTTEIHHILTDLSGGYLHADHSRT